jgi:hypothetical protein
MQRLRAYLRRVVHRAGTPVQPPVSLTGDGACQNRQRRLRGRGAVPCSVCGAAAFRDWVVVWDELATEWELSAEERALVDRQQGTVCTDCGANLRSIVLADAILSAEGYTGTLEAFVATPEAAHLDLLEVNEAGTLSPLLRQIAGHRLAAYPEVDMQKMPYPDASFDLVVHSDTLEHIAEPVLALAECLRVLRSDGALCFTVPILPNRLTKSRKGLPRRYHGDPGTSAEDLVVRNEFGADAWLWPLRAGFSSVELRTSEFPAAFAVTARGPRNAVSPSGSSAASPARYQRAMGLSSDDMAITRTTQLREPELWVRLRGAADWTALAQNNPGGVSRDTASRIVAGALAAGISSRFLGDVPANEVAMLGTDPREALLVRGLNSRQRAVLEIFATDPRAHDIHNCRIYAHEGVTTFALTMRGRYPYFIGSEYAPDNSVAAGIWPVPVVDIARSGFPDDAFDFVL